LILARISSKWLVFWLELFGRIDGG